MTDNTNVETQRLETKSGGSVGAAFEEFMRAFEAYKDTNDERLSELERRSSSDPLIDDKLARLDRALDETKRVADRLAVKAQRPHLVGGEIETAAVREHRRAFDDYVRKGETANLSRLEAKALAVTTNSGADGGYLVPPETERAVISALKDISPIRSIASVRQVSGSVFKKPFATSGFATGWVAETAARTQTNTPALAELAFPTMELYAMPAATATLLDDNAVNIDEWIAEEVRDTFAQQEGTAFVSGDGTNKPKGFLDYTKVADGSWSWGNIGFIKTGVDGGFPATNPADKLIDLIYTLKSGYRAGGTFVFNRGTQAAIRKMKDEDGNYVWQPASAAGEPSLLMGYPVVESEDMPAIATDSFSVAFGDFRRGYLIVDRVGIRVLRDPYSSKPYVLFYTTKRVGGGVQDFNAIKLLKFEE
ncbi:phage major capsid protein [Hyphomicrobium sp. DMF-1]|uniref:phage major capsid protein n=1 Tax=Hyphomicrobium sp. DMF-1 TaxID=3019544 RepID=UPI0022EBC07B|nr:phage major capsid protein [Hyphomicrobium sp. DMF-1]WBT36678.1 phage major capsid protein [Hyphomicrobium sp. DMF-1]